MKIYITDDFLPLERGLKNRVFTLSLLLNKPDRQLKKKTGEK